MLFAPVQQRVISIGLGGFGDLLTEQVTQKNARRVRRASDISGVLVLLFAVYLNREDPLGWMQDTVRGQARAEVRNYILFSLIMGTLVSRVRERR